MKKFLKIVCIIVLLISLFVAYMCYKSKTIENETSSLVEDSVNTITTSWDSVELKKRADPLVLEAATKQGQSLDELFNAYKKLGHPKSPAKCAYINFTAASDISGSYLLVRYKCSAEYDNDKATIYVQIKKDSGKSDWLFTTFRVDSPLFTKLLAK